MLKLYIVSLCLNDGLSRKEVFDGFVGSDEFTAICESYGITRG